MIRFCDWWMSWWGGPSEHISMLCHINIQASRISQLPCSPAGSEVMEMLMSLQEALPAAEEGGTDLSSLLLVLLHQRRFSTDWWKAKQQRQTTVFIASQPQFRRTPVIRPLPQRFTSLNSSDHSGPAFSQILPTSSCHQSDVLLPFLFLLLSYLLLSSV